MYMYFAVKDGQPVIHADGQEMVNLGFDLSLFSEESDEYRKMSENRFIGFSRTVRVKNGKLVFGLTGKEKAEKEASDRIAVINSRLVEIDRDFGKRHEREWHLANNQGLNDNARAQLEEAETRASTLRLERTQLEISIA